MDSRRWLAVTVITLLSAGLAVAGEPARAAPSPAATCTSTWIGPAGGAWTDAANWRPAAVPTRTSDVCISSRPGPTLGQVNVRGLYVHRSSMRITKSLSSHNLIHIDTTDLSGPGEVSAKTAVLSGVHVRNALSVRVKFLALSGARGMCGGQLAICLDDTSTVDAATLGLSGGDIGGDTTANPALNISGSLTISDAAAHNTYRIAIPMSAPYISNQAQSATPPSLVLTAWSQLSAAGTLGGVVDGSTQLARSVTTISSRGGLYGAGVVTADGQYAGSTVYSNSGALALDDSVMITPAGGVLVSKGPIFVSAPGATIDGALETFPQPNNEDGLDVAPGATLTTTADVTSRGGYVTLAGTLNGPALHMHGNYVDVPETGRLFVESLTLDGPNVVGLNVDGGGRVTAVQTAVVIPNSGELNTRGGCNARIAAPLTLSAGAETITRLDDSTASCRSEYAVDGPARLNGTLVLDSLGTARVGDGFVLLRSSAGITGQFSTVSGVNDGPNHWELSYSAKQVVATLVAGNV